MAIVVLIFIGVLSDGDMLDLEDVGNVLGESLRWVLGMKSQGMLSFIKRMQEDV